MANATSGAAGDGPATVDWGTHPHMGTVNVAVGIMLNSVVSVAALALACARRRLPPLQARSFPTMVAQSFACFALLIGGWPRRKPRRPRARRSPLRFQAPCCGRRATATSTGASCRP